MPLICFHDDLLADFISVKTMAHRVESHRFAIGFCEIHNPDSFLKTTDFKQERLDWRILHVNHSIVYSVKNEDAVYW